MKHFIKLLFVLVLVFTLYLIGSIVDITWKQYQATKDWESISIKGQLKDVPPFLAKNYINLDDKEAVETWQEVNKILADLAKDGQIKPENLENYREVLKHSIKMQEAYNITSGDVADQNKQLALYLEVEDTLRTAYDTPKTEELKSLTGKLYSANLDNSSAIQVNYLNRLKQVAKDYKEAKKFIKDTLPKLGTLSDGVLMGSTEMDEESTDEFIKEVREQKLDRFSFINDLLTRLKGDEWIKVLTHNQIIDDYELWQEAKSDLYNVDASDYVLVGDIKTYGDALDANLNTDVVKSDGYIIDKESKVISITYDGEILPKDKYIKRGANALVSIQASYKPKKKKSIEDEQVKVIDASTTQASSEVSTEVTTEVTTEIDENRDLPPVVITEETTAEERIEEHE